MRINPLAAEVKNRFAAVQAQTESFVRNPDSAINGMIVSGDAGVGKSYTVRRALQATGHTVNTEYVKGGKMTAASLYVKLYLNRMPNRIIVLDDCDVIHHGDRRQIIPMLLGAAELGQCGEVSWETARANPLMVEYGVPMQFEFRGSIIWITNDTKTTMRRALKQWDKAIMSRFNFAECNFTDEQKFMYTLHLIEHEDMLGGNCGEYVGGYPQSIIDETLDYLSTNYKNLVEITPRQAIKVADILHHNSDPALRSVMLQQLWK